MAVVSELRRKYERELEKVLNGNSVRDVELKVLNDVKTVDLHFDLFTH